MIHPDDIKGTGPKNANLSEALRDLHDWANTKTICDPENASAWREVKEWSQGTAAHYGVGMRRKPSPSNTVKSAATGSERKDHE